MSIYNSLVATAKRLIRKYAVTPSQWTVSGETTARPAYVVYKTTTAGDAWLRFMPGSDVTEGNVDAVMAAQSFTPTNMDSVVDPNGKEYSIKSVNPVQPSGQVIVWKIEFNK